MTARVEETRHGPLDPLGGRTRLGQVGAAQAGRQAVPFDRIPLMSATDELTRARSWWCRRDAGGHPGDDPGGCR